MLELGGGGEREMLVVVSGCGQGGCTVAVAPPSADQTGALKSSSRLWFGGVCRGIGAAKDAGGKGSLCGK